MNSIYQLFSFLFDFTLVGAGLFFAIKLLQFRSHLHAKNELQRIQARISILRMNLKAKVKKRANAFRSYYAKSIVPNEILDRDLSALVEIKFESGNDFQQYFDFVQNTHTLIAAIHNEVESPVKAYEELDLKNEQIIIRIVKEMHDGSTNYNEKIEAYNTANPKNKMTLIDPIQFSSMHELFQNLHIEANTEVEDKKTEAA